MRSLLIAVPLFLVSLVAGTAQAGWWHHHHRHCCPVYQAVPGYYMPAYQPQVQMVQGQSAIGETLLLELVRKLVPTPGTPSPPNPGTPVATSEIKQDLADIKASLKNLDARVENINSTVQAHGEAFGMIMTELKELRNRNPGGAKLKTKEELGSLIDADMTLRDSLNALLAGANAQEKRLSRDEVIDTLLKLLNK